MAFYMCSTLVYRQAQIAPLPQFLLTHHSATVKVSFVVYVANLSIDSILSMI